MKRIAQSGKAGRMSLIIAATIMAATLIATVRVETVASMDERNIENLATKRVQPAYPPLAQKYRIEGTVTVQVSVGNDGKVTQAEFVRGHNIFRSVSLDAAKRWEFKPPGNGSLQGTVQFVFKLNN
ncbi:MAG TPA: energy transducer TonB [Blastocatellia bacterium]|jgi:TonB family protein